MRKFLPLSGCLLVCSCVLGPDPSEPDPNAPSAIRGDHAPHGESFGDKAWRQVFTDPAMRSLIEQALSNNPDLVAATFRIEQARAAASSARSDWFPQVGGSAGASTDYSPARPGGGSRSSETYDLTAGLSWELDLWGGIRRSNQSARARLLEAQYQRDAVQTSLVAAVATAYVELKNLDERLAISKRTAESREQSLKLVISRRDGGVSSDLEVGQAEALLGQARTAIPITEQAIAAKENEIRFLLGEFPARVARGGSIDGLDRSLRIKGGLPSTLLQRRPDVAAANQSYQAAVAGIGVAEALRLPSLSLTGSGGLLSNQFDNLLNSNSATYTIGPRLAGPIFDAGRGKARVDAAKARAGEALASHNRAAKLAFREAADAINNHTKSGEIITEQTRLVEALRKVANVATERFEGGESSYLEVLDAERSLFFAELELADARRNRLLAVVQTYRALGGGWK
jgi:multidrug efflux system outer membrane protein